MYAPWIDSVSRYPTIRFHSLIQKSDIVRSKWQPTAYAYGGTIDILSSKSQPTNPGKSTLTIEPVFNTARRHSYPRCKTQVPVGSIRSRDHLIQGTFAFLNPVDTSLPGECARLVITGRTYAVRTPTLPSYYAATASRVRASPEIRVLNL
jgi:hypothetical protein